MNRIFLYEPLNQVTLLQQMITNSLSFVYYGHFSNKVNDALIPLVESLIENSDVELKIRKRAFYIFVECVQNVNRHHYREKEFQPSSKEIFILRENKNRFNIALGNNMLKKEKNPLKNKIDKLNNLSADALNAHYKMVLEENVITHKGGAGLGLIEVARKSGSKMKYKFENDHPVSSYFTIETNINETDVLYSYPEYESVNDIELLRRYYLSHEMGLLLKYKTEYFKKNNVDKLVSSINSLGVQKFFRQQQSSTWIHKIIQSFQIHKRSLQQTRNNLILHFFEKGMKKFMIVGWTTNMGQKQFNLLVQSFQKDKGDQKESPFSSLVTAVNALNGGLDEKPKLDQFSFPGQGTLLMLQIPIE